MSDKVIVSKSEIEANLYNLIFECTGFNVNIRDDAETVDGIKRLINHILNNATPVSGAVPQFPVMLRKMWSGSEVQEWINQNTTPQPAPDTVPVERFNKLVEACELLDEAGRYDYATTTFNTLINKARALKAEAIKGE